MRKNGFSINPNPSFWYIDVSLPDNKTASYYIANNQGSIMQKGVIQEGNERINIESLAAGKYSLHVINKEFKMVKSFIKLDQ